MIARLSGAGCVAAEGEAAELLGSAPDDDTLHGWIRRRERGEPLPWITGTTRFCGHTVRVDAGVYVPRAQSEALAHRAAALLPGDGVAADLCTGSGAIALHLARTHPASLVVGVDSDVRAAACARRNGVHVVVGDLGQPLRAGAFDVVTAVAPYVPTAQLRLLPADVQRYEPRRALDGGGDGLALVRRAVEGAARALRPGGWLLLEVGGDQDRRLRATLTGFGFGAVSTWDDDEGDLRGLAARAAW